MVLQEKIKILCNVQKTGSVLAAEINMDYLFNQILIMEQPTLVQPLII
jgi:hypothetical protein